MIFHTPCIRRPRRNIAIPFGTEKTRMVGLPDGEKNFEDMCNRIDTILACNRRTDRRTDILPRHSPRYAYAR